MRPEGISERAIFVVDKDGVIQYIDIHDIDDQPSNDELRRILRRIDPKAEAAAPTEEVAVPVELPKGGVVLYCTKWCPDCRKARNWLVANGVEYTEVDITTVKGAAEQVMAWANGNRTTPTFDIAGEIVVDWDEAAVVKVLKNKGYLG